MSKGWCARGTAERRRLEAAFIAEHGAELLLGGDVEDDLLTASDEPAPGRQSSFASLYGALHRPGPFPDEMSASLGGDRRLREDFALLLQRRARHHVPRAAAAAGRDALRSREAGGFRIRIVDSRASSEQVYLLIEMPETGGAVPSRLVVGTAAGVFLKCDLPPPDAGAIRLVMAAADPVVQALGEPASEVFFW